MTTGSNKTALSILLYVIVLGTVAYFGLTPALNNLKSNREKLTEKQAELDNTHKKLESLQKASKNPELQKISETVNTYWPDNLDVSYFIVQTENLAKNNNLIIENFSVEQPKATKTTKKSTIDESDDKKKSDSGEKTQSSKKTSMGTQFTFTTKSSYNSILSLIKDMEILPRYNSISMLSINGDQDGQVDLRLTGNIYYGK